MHYILITGLTTAQAGQHTRGGHLTVQDSPHLPKGEIAVQTPTEEPASAQDSTTDGSPEVVTVVYGNKPEGGLGLQLFQTRRGDGDHFAVILMHNTGESTFRPGLEHLEPFVGSIIHAINGQSLDVSKPVESVRKLVQDIPVGEHVELTFEPPHLEKVELQFDSDDSIQIAPLEFSVNMDADGAQIYNQAADAIILSYPDLMKRSTATITELLYSGILEIYYGGEPLFPTDHLEDIGLTDESKVNVKWKPGVLKKFLDGAHKKMAAEEAHVLRLMEQGQADDAIANTVKWRPGEVKEFIDINERKFEEQAQKIIEMKKKHRASRENPDASDGCKGGCRPGGDCRIM